MLFLIILSLNKPLPLERKVSIEFSIQKDTKGSYIYEDFEVWPPNTFILNPASGAGVWQQSPVNSTDYISPQRGKSGDHGAEFDVWSYSEGTIGDMISEPVNLSGTSSPNLSFYFWNHTDLTGYGNEDSTIVSISTDGGGSWSNIVILKGDVDDWTQQIYSLNSYIGDTIIIRFRGVSDYGGSNMGIDFVEIGEKPSIDAGITVILSPDEYIDPVTPLTPSCEINSIGIDTVYDFYTYIQVDSMGNLIHKDSLFVDTLIPGKNDTVQFAQVILSPGFYYEFTYFTALSGDEYFRNDSLLAISKYYTSDRVVIGELFSNTSCGYCRIANDTLNQIFPDYPDNLALIRYHTWWPSSSDPFYSYNTYENRVRTFYYNADDYVPHFFIDGDVDAGSSRDSYRSLINEETMKPSPFDISISGTYDYFTLAGSLFVDLNATGEPLESDLYLRYCMIENGINYSAPNGETQFYQIFRDMIPNPTGIPLSIHYGESFVDTQTFTINVVKIVEDSVEFAIFVQSNENKHILQGAKISLPVLAGIDEESTNIESLNIINAPSIIVRDSGSELKFSLKSAASVNISIYDIAGRLKMIVLNRKMNNGVHSFNINTDELKSGLYFVLFNCNGDSEVRKITVFK